MSTIRISTTVPRAATVALALAAGAIVAAGVTSVALAGDLDSRLTVGASAIIAVITVALAALVSWRQPANAVAPLLAWMALVAPAVAFSDSYLPAQHRRPDLLPHLPGAIAALLVVAWVWIYLSLALVLLLFPDGRLPGQRWRWVAAGLPLTAIAIHLLMVASPGPYDAPYATLAHPLGDLPGGAATALKVVLFPLMCALGLAAAWSLRVRYRAGDSVLRAQLKWLALAALGVPLTIALSWGGDLAFGTHDLAAVGFDFLFIAIPAAMALAVLRHDLYDVDRALSAAATYTLVTLGVLSVFGAASFLSGVVLGGQSAVAAAGVTAVTALALAPLRRRLQQRVDRRLYPVRAAALEAVETLHAEVTAGGAQPEDLEPRLRRALRDPGLRVGVVMPGGTDFVDARGEPFALAGAMTPVTVEGSTIGAVVSSSPTPAPLAREIAAASAMLVEMARLRLELSDALREVQASRARLQRIGDAERRALERDLHDGAQQRLVSLGMSLRLAQRHLDDESIDVDGVLDEAVAQLQTAVSELREVAHGLRPGHLNEGLPPALAALAESSALPIDLEVEGGGEVPDQIATTAYYVASESVANVVKHAGATRVLLRVAQDDRELCVRVQDDGRGGATVRPGSGLGGLSDRVAAAGGWLRVRSASGAGTTVEAVLPCAS